MSTLLTAQSLSLDTPFGPLLADITLTLKKGDRLGLIGHNGCGKSTLLKLLDGTITPKSGSVALASQCLMARVEQHLPERLHPLTMLEAVLARALITEPDLLLLDEPSNHLDLPTLLWLERFLRGWNGSFVLVSHDAHLLDNVTNGTWILRDRSLSFFQLPCTQARAALEERDRTDAQRHKAEQKEIDRIAASAKRLAIWGRVYDNEDLARKAKQMEKHIDRLKDEQTELSQGHQWQLILRGEKLQADRLLEMENLYVSPAPGAAPLFHLPVQRLKSGDRVAIIGRNGCGKSSLLRLLWQQYQQPEREEAIRLHPRAQMGYYDQTLHQLRDNDTLLQALEPFAPLSEQDRKMALISAGFPWLRHQQAVSTLSGGERSRLLFVGLTLARYSLLMLDEPTNHLDMEGKEALAETLQTFEGGVLLVTHDRTLIAKSCNRFWLVDNGELSEWHDPQALYALLTAEENGEPVIQTSEAAAQMSADKHDADALLERLVALENRLAGDLARKEKHQKPALQPEWRKEIAELNRLLKLH